LAKSVKARVARAFRIQFELYLPFRSLFAVLGRREQPDRKRQPGAEPDQRQGQSYCDAIHHIIPLRVHLGFPFLSLLL